MLWDIIRDFFVQYVWGGFTSTGANYAGRIGYLKGVIGGNPPSVDDEWIADITEISFKFTGSNYFDGGDYILMNLGDWLSTTSTIIVLILMCIFLYVFIRWAFRLTAGLFQGR